MKKQVYKRYRRWFDLLLKRHIPFFSQYVQDKIYDHLFYEDANELKKQSSEKVAEIIDSFFNFHSVLDIGCGCGLYIEELHRLGKEVLGCDASIDAINMAAKEFTVFYCNVTEPLILNRKFDLVICIEVAEHIRKKYSRQLVKNCTCYGDTVVFTAAPKGQGGVGHINEQPYRFWIRLFAENHFRYDRDLSEQVRTVMKEKNVVQWIANNFMSFSRSRA
ncbi:MAG: class I SAM-dependent methyltransferase [Candidatus Aminicenantes bacterium]|jgi:2-polyprenyl-3-methyl-5-hydroxy-6-metoxy-1,4-benzoquinol methylase